MRSLRFLLCLGLSVPLGACERPHAPRSRPAQGAAADSIPLRIPVDAVPAKDTLAAQSDSFARRRQDPRRWHVHLHRQPTETLGAMVQREVPHFFSDAGWPVAPDSAATVAWRPTRFGKQQVLFRRGPAAEGGYLFLLDPVRRDTYGLHVFSVPAVEMLSLEALALADVDRDGQLELLALYDDSYREAFPDEQAAPGEPTYLVGHADHFFTQVYRYTGVNRQGLPQYREDPHPYQYLDNLATMAQVRRALARHQRRLRRPPPVRRPPHLLRVDSALRSSD